MPEKLRAAKLQAPTTIGQPTVVSSPMTPNQGANLLLERRTITLFCALAQAGRHWGFHA
jgi:hypothetical protein